MPFHVLSISPPRRSFCATLRAHLYYIISTVSPTSHEQHESLNYCHYPGPDIVVVVVIIIIIVLPLPFTRGLSISSIHPSRHQYAMHPQMIYTRALTNLYTNLTPRPYYTYAYRSPPTREGSSTRSDLKLGSRKWQPPTR